MPFFSNLRRWTVVDERGRRGRVIDLVADMLAAEHPPVTHVLFKADDRTRRAIVCDSACGVDEKACVFRVRDLDSSQAVDEDASEIWLGRDVLDSLVLDLENRRATRANDLVVESVDGRLSLRAADTSPTAVLRRITRGWLGRTVRDEHLYDWRYVEFLDGDPTAVRCGAGEHLRITRLPAGEIAGLANSIPYRHAAELLMLLPEGLAADTLEVMEPQRQLQAFEELTDERAEAILALLPPEDAADLIGRLAPEEARRALERLPEARRKMVVALLKYPEESVGGVMTNEILMAAADWTVAETRARLRDQLSEPDFVYFVYVVADEESRRLRGVVTLRDLLTADEGAKLSDVANPYLVTLEPEEAAWGAAFRLLNSQLLALPVVSSDMRLLGAMTVDAAVNIAAPPVWRGQAPRIFS